MAKPCTFVATGLQKKTLHIDYSCASDAVISIGGRHNCSRAHTTVQQREIKHRVSANSTTVEAHTPSDYISAHHKSHTHSKNSTNAGDVKVVLRTLVIQKCIHHSRSSQRSIELVHTSSSSLAIHKSQQYNTKYYHTY